LCDSWQAGHSEEWLCTIFSNLTEELEIALRAAWHATMVVHSQCMRQAEPPRKACITAHGGPWLQCSDTRHMR
jgi:hypothetical protein